MVWDWHLLEFDAVWKACVCWVSLNGCSWIRKQQQQQLRIGCWIVAGISIKRRLEVYMITCATNCMNYLREILRGICLSSAS